MLPKEDQPPVPYDHLPQGKRLIMDLAALRGAVLGCYCKPEACHGDTLVNASEWAWNWLQENITDEMKRFPAPKPDPRKSAGADKSQYTLDHDGLQEWGL